MSNYPNKKNTREKYARPGEGKQFRPRGTDNRPPRREETTVSENIVAGRNSVRELLKSGRSVDKLFVRSGDREGSITVIVAEAIRMGIPVIEVDGSKLDAMTGGAHHQGVAAMAAEKQYVSLEEIVEIARNVGAYVVCDEIYRGLSEEYMYSICDLYEKGIATAGTSKIFSSAGLRLGWIVTRDLSIKETLMNHRSYNSICEGPINEWLGAIVLENKDVFYRRNKAICDAGRAALEEWVRENPHFSIACPSMSSTSYLFYDFDIPAIEFAQGLYDTKSVLVCHGDCFELEHSFRLGYGFGDTEYLKAGLREITAYVKELEDAGRI